jgi:hypothetical protein
MTKYRHGNRLSVVISTRNGLLLGALALTVAIPLGSAPSAMGDIPWRSGAAPVQPQTVEQVRTSLDALAQRPDQRHVVVQFQHPLLPQQRIAMERSGLRLLSYLGDNAFFARLPLKGVDVRVAAQSGLIAHVAPIQRVLKIHPAIVANRLPGFAVVDRSDPADPTIAVYAQFHRGISLVNVARATVRKHGATVIDQMKSVNTLVIELPQSKLMALADEDVVQWIEPPLPPFSEVNDSNRTLTQVDALQSSPFNLDGSGVGVMVYDGGSGLASHADFSGRLTTHDSSVLSDHSTHVAGTIGGDGSAGGGLYRGMAPAVLLESYGFQWDGTGTFLYTNPGDLESDYNDAVNSHGADITNNSIGTNTETNGFPCEIQGDYGVTSQLIDSIVRGSLGSPYRIVWANGNERQGSRCDVEGFGKYYSTAPPAGAKNHIAVGALNSNSEGMTSFSSWGPVDDGRMKPDVSASGCQGSADNGVTSTSSNGGYSVKCGTSMAAPTVTGLCALILEDYRVQFSGQGDPRNATLKALLAHNAKDKWNPGPDYQFGYGMVKGQETIDFMRSGNFDESQQVSQGGVMAYQALVTAADAELKITLVWDDFPGTPNVNPALVNDLDLVVVSPTGVRAYPWTLDPSNPSARATRDKINTIDNMEQVLVEAPEPGLWTIQVQGSSVPQGPQSFSICAGPILVSDGVTLALPDGPPQVLAPGTSTSISVQIIAQGENIVTGSETLHYRYDGGIYQNVPLAFLGGDLYEATLPPAGCTDTPEFYVSAAGTVSGTKSLPAAAPASVLSAAVATATVVLDDDMESNQGWTVGAPTDTATTGIWTRVDPIGTEAQPEDDHSAAGGTTCFVTGQGTIGGSLGENDIDGGPTTLTTPNLDLSTFDDATVSYYRWFNNATGAEPNADLLTVDISNDGGTSWTNVETIGPEGEEVVGGWILSGFNVADYVVPTNQVRIRFVAADSAGGSVVEAAVDDVLITGLACAVASCLVDTDCDDALLCTIDMCSGGACSNTPVNCDDTDACTTDSCDPGTGACTNDTIGCDDGDSCTIDVCDAITGCASTPIDCDDGSACTTDTCTDGSCSNDTISCDDGDSCTIDVCDAITGCASTPIDCDDGSACTTDTCTDGSCSNDTISCDDGDGCTVDSCDTTLGCINDPIVCPVGETCVGGVCQIQTCNNNGSCETGEDCINCTGDCFSSGGGGCGDGVCGGVDADEDCFSCSLDCRCTGGSSCRRSCCGDGICQSENVNNCPVDCDPGFTLPAPSCCGDGLCEGGEDSCNCDVDCGAPVAEICNNGIDDDCDGFADGTDSDCPCDPKGAACSTGMTCCSGACKRNGTCR